MRSRHTSSGRRLRLEALEPRWTLSTTMASATELAAGDLVVTQGELLNDDTTPPSIQGLPIPSTIEVGSSVDIATAWDESGPIVVRAYVSQQQGGVPANSVLVATAEASSGTLTVSAALPLGNWYVWAQAADPTGNTATVWLPGLVTVIDTTGPSIFPPADITILAWEDTSPANTGTATATDNSGDAPAIGYSDVVQVGSEATLITRTWTAIDGSLNQSSASQRITVITNPSQLVPSLSQQIHDMGLTAGTPQSLDAKLDAALSNLQSGNVRAAQNELAAFIHYVEAQRGKQLTDEQTNELLAAANAIREILGANSGMSTAHDGAFASWEAVFPH